MKKVLLFAICLVCPLACFAQTGHLPALSVQTAADGAKSYSLSIQILLFMTALTVLPALLMSMTAFTRIIIVLAILRQAMGMSTTPTNQILIGMSLFLTIFIMAPVWQQVQTTALDPYMAQKIDAKQALTKASTPLKKFMLSQTREKDLTVFAKIAGHTQFNSQSEIPISILMPAFLTSELKTAFHIGFLLFLPFLIIDLIVASILMAMGMMMLSPLIISLPFKIMLFVLVDGWAMVMGTLASSFVG